jgi:MFS family permease
VVSLTGNVLTTLAVPWFVLETTGSAAKAGITGAFAFLPIVIAGVFGGAVVDRLGFRRTSILADLASGATVAAIALLSAVGALEFWMLLALVFVGALLDAPGETARAALVPDLAELAGVGIERASAATQVVQRSSRLVGAPLAGVLIAAAGPANALWLDAASFALSAGIVAVAVPRAPRLAAERSSGSYLADLATGFRFILEDRLILALVLTVMVTNFLDAAKSSVLYPVYANEVLGSAVGLGLMFGASGGGAVVGAVVYGAIGHRLPRRAVFIPAFVVVGLPALVFATTPPLWVIVVTQAIGGLAAGPLNPIMGAVEYERIPAELRGRVFGAMTAGAWAAMPVAVIAAGYLVEGIGLRATLVGVGVCYLAATFSLAVNPAIREMDVAAPRDPTPR